MEGWRQGGRQAKERKKGNRYGEVEAGRGRVVPGRRGQAQGQAEAGIGAGGRHRGRRQA
jgi:hypothetical protein